MGLQTHTICVESRRKMPPTRGWRVANILNKRAISYRIVCSLQPPDFSLAVLFGLHRGKDQMKRFLILLSLLFCNMVYADTINLHWVNYDGSTYDESTCVIDSDLILPSTTPTRYGYTFTGWEILSYRPLEYIETGNGSIDTRIIPNVNTKIKVQASTNNPSGDNYIIGDSSYVSLLSFFNGGVGWHMCANGRLDSDKTIQSNTVYTIEASNGILKVNNTIYNCTPRTFSVTGTMKMLTKGNVKIYNLQIYENDVLVRDFVPAIDTNNKTCMYDKIEKKFYYKS